MQKGKVRGLSLVLLLGLSLGLAACGNSDLTPAAVSGVLAQPATPTTLPQSPKPATATATNTPWPTATLKPTPATVVRAKLGQSVLTQDGIRLTVKNTERSKQFTKTVVANSSYTLLAVEIEVENTTTKPFYVGSDTFIIRDGDNKTYGYKVYGKFPALHDQAATIKQGQKNSGWLTYEVPEVGSGFLLDYKNESEQVQIELD